MFCQNCGKEMNDGANFCSNCGWSKFSLKVDGIKKVLHYVNILKSKISAMIDGIKKHNIKTLSVVVSVIILLLVIIIKNLFFGVSFKNAKLVTRYSVNTTIDKMATVKFGSYPQSDANGNKKEPIEWIVLDRQSDKTLLLSKYIIDFKCYNETSDDVTWETCSLRKWLNSDFYNSAFSSSEQNKILTTNVINSGNSVHGTNGGNNTNDKIFCLSIDEVKKYFNQDNMESDNKRLATKGTNYAKTGSCSYSTDNNKWFDGNSDFWLRSPGNSRYNAANVGYDGSLDTSGDNVDDSSTGVRPALWVSNLKSSKNKSITSKLFKKTGMVEENGAKYFYDDSGNKVVSNWKNVGGSWYYFDIDGKCVINDWRKIDDAYYYFNEEGIMQKDKWIENKYYVNASGKMLVNALTPDGYYVNKDGEYVDKVCFTTRKLISIFNEYNSLQPDKLEDYIVNSLKINSKWLLYSWYAKEKDAAFDDGGNLWLYGKSNWEYSDAGCSYALKIDKNMTQTLYCNEHGHFNGYEAGMMEFSYINGQEVNSYNPYYGDSYIAILLEDINLSNYENIVHYNGGFYINDVLITNNWVYYNSHNYYVNSAGGIETNKWIGDRYVGSDGAMQTGGKTPDGYYIGRDGYAVKDINKDLEDSKLLEEIKGEAWYKTKAGLWYYFEKDRKTLRKGWFNDNRDNQTYYLDKNTGIMAVGWTEIDGSLYYFNESYENEPNWYEVGDGIYESFGKKVKSYGSMYKNEMTPDGKQVDENGKLIETSVSNNISNANGDIIKFGNYMITSSENKDAIEWIVLDKQNDKTLLLSKYIIDCKCYNETRDKVTWETCSLRKWLNNDFYNAVFTNDEKNKILTTNLNQIDNPNNNKSKGGNSTNDKIFLLSIDEVQKYFNQNGLSPDNHKLAALPTEYAKSKDNSGEKLWINNDNSVWHNGYGYFWLRSPGIYQRDAAGVDSNGGLDVEGKYVDVKVIGVRPAMWVKN